MWGCRRRARTRLVVHPCSDEDHRGADDEGRCDAKIEEDDGGEEGDEDGEAGGEALEDVVRVLDDDGGDEAAKDLYGDGGPGPEAKVAEQVEVEEVRGRECGCRVCGGGGGEDGEEGGDEGEEGELDVADP